MRELKVDAICEGTVIDHIPAGKAFKILDMLGIGSEDQVLIATHLLSSKLGKKDVIKIENRILSDDELSSISLLANDATISIIENFIPRKKFTVTIPDTIKTIIKCPNRHCITNHEPVTTRFSVESKTPLKIRCSYCERVFDTEINKHISLTHFVDQNA